MNRRGFLRFLGTGAAVTIAEPQWPFRVYSFLKSPNGLDIAQLEAAYHQTLFGYDEPDIMIINKLTAKYLIPKLGDEIFKPSPIWFNLANKSKLT